MKLGRAISKFARNRIYGWNATSSQWEMTPALGGLQVFDRFITERSFGQKKRILTVSNEMPIPTQYALIKVGEQPAVFMLEHVNEDVRYSEAYALTYLLHEAKFHCTARKESVTVNAAGVPLKTGVTDLFQTWIDVERFTSAASRRFEETEFTVVTLTFPAGTVIDTNTYVELDSGARYNVDEVYDTLDLIQAKGKRVGE